MRRSTTVSVLLVLAACSNADTADQGARASGSEVAATAVAGDELPTVLVYKTPTCGCCSGWIEHLEAAGFAVDARDLRDLMSVKRDAGVPLSMSSCHTAMIDGYVVEGHVPIEQVKRLLAERPAIAGIAVPGMPVGSPGMEGRNAQPYQVLSFDAAGNTAVYAEIDPR